MGVADAKVAGLAPVDLAGPLGGVLRIAPLFVVQRISKWPLRAIVNGIFYVLKNGCVWRDVPADLPPWVTVYCYFAKWSADDTWERVSGCLSIAARERAKKRPT